MTFDVADFTMASAAFFIACPVAAAASLAASADFLLKSSILDCCSLTLALKSATESCHQRDKSSKKPRFSAGAEGAAAAGAGGCAGSATVGGFGDAAGDALGSVPGSVPGDVAGCGPAGAAAELGGPPLCARAALNAQTSTKHASKAPRAQPSLATSKLLQIGRASCR